MTANPPQDYRALLKRSLVAIDELKARVAELEQAQSEPIAVIGLGCRMPGGVKDPESLWQLLATGVDAVTEVPPDRWDVDAYFDPDPDALGKTYSRWGAFLDNVDRFDAHFFGISPREAVSMDPQQRLLLEVVWESLEHAGIGPARLAGSQTAVYLGVSTQDYSNRILEAQGPSRSDAYASSGTADSMAAGRISYVLGLHGPNVALDTACSSSLVATHLAMLSLRNGEADLALAAGVNLTLTPNGSILTSRGRMTSPTGRCHTFDAAADGYVRGEGCAVLVLKRLSDARRDGDRVMAVIRGSAINQDGRSSGLTAPYGPAQEAVIKAALANARLAPTDVGYVEAHGTGTSLGDPIEVKALGEVYGRGRRADQPLMVGSIKTNVGHLEGAAGVAGLAKAIVALQHKQLPPHLHFHTPNPLIPWDKYPITVPTTLTDWAVAPDQRRRVGISSFGFSGTNAHVILEEAPPAESTAAPVDRASHLLVLSAQTPDALTALARDFAGYFDRADAAALADVAATAANGRSHFGERLAVVAGSSDEARDRLRAAASGEIVAGVARGRAGGNASPDIVFMFTGQGAQYPGMARELYETQPSFRRTVDRCAAIVDQYLDRPLLEVLFADQGAVPLVDQTTYTQPALFVVEYALAELWRSWGAEPAVVLGHSVGEYVAACVAGVFSLEDALQLIAARGRLMGALPRDGGMAAVFATEAAVAQVLSEIGGPIAIAGINGPTNVVISGRNDLIDRAVQEFAGAGVEAQRLNVSHAFHSPLMDPILEEFEQVAQKVRFASPQIGLVSNVTGRMAGPEIQTARYWREHLRAAVRFADSIATLDRDGYRLFLEVGPHPTLTGMARRCLPDGHATWLASLRKGRSDWAAMLENLGQLYVNGLKADWTGFEHDYASARRRVVLPTYPFQRERYWLELESAHRQALAPTASGHPLLGGKVLSPLDIFETSIDLAEFPFLADHRIAGLTLFPGTGYLELARAAAAEVRGGAVTLEQVAIQEAMEVPDSGTVTVQVVLTPAGQAETFQIFSATGDDPKAPVWKLHASGTVVAAAAEPGEAYPIDVARSRAPDVVDVPTYYEKLAAVGAEYGPVFRGITEIHRGVGEVVGRIVLPGGATTAGRYGLHPALLDACFQLTGAALPDTDTDASDSDVYVPVGIGAVETFRPGASDIWCHVTLTADGQSGGNVAADLLLVDAEGQVVARVANLTLRRVSRQTLERLFRKRAPGDGVFEVVWRQVPSSSAATDPTRWLIVGAGRGVAHDLADRLRGDGHRVDLAVDGAAWSREGGVWQVDLTDRVQVDRLLADVRAADDRSLYGIVYLSGVDASPGSFEVAQQPERATLGALHLANAAAESGARLWLVTAGGQPVDGSIPDPAQAPVWGLGAVVAAEYPAMSPVRLDLAPDPASHLDALLDALLRSDDETQVAYRGGHRFVARLVPAQVAGPAAEQPVRLEIPTRGQLDYLALQPMRRTPPGPGEVEIRVHATGLNFRDVLNALGMYPGDPGPLGNECAGVVSAVGAGVEDLAIGDEVITMVDQSFATYVLAPAILTVRKPASLTFAEAATIPVTFLTADYALNHLGRMKAGDRVLVHAATGGVGMAAIQLAKRAGAEIFGTAGNPTKRAVAKELGAHHVSDSRSLAFVEEVRAATNGEGVDIALNSLAGEFIPKTLELLRPGGRFIEIGKTDAWNQAVVDAQYTGLEYYLLYLGEITAADPALIRRMFLDLLADFERGTLTPLPQHLFPIEQSVEAFRFMAQAKHMGKVVITQRHGSAVRSDASYLVTGGTGGLGIAVARWLVAQGARDLVLTARRPPTEAARAAVADLEAAGARVTVAQGDVAVREDVARILAAARRDHPPLRGIVHAAGIVEDRMLPDQDAETFRRVMAPKVAGTWHLHQLTERDPLDFFVLFSSGAALLGSPGQGNYAAANLFLDMLAHHRQAKGLPALSINWGSWSEVGMAASVGEQHRRRWAALGLEMITPDDGVRALGEVLAGAVSPRVAVLPLTLSKLTEAAGPFFRELLAAVSTTGTVAEPAVDMRAVLAAAAPEDRRGLIVEFLKDQLIRVLALSPSYRVDPDRSIMEMGLDSLMAMELRNRLEANFQVVVAVADLLLGPSTHDLAATIEGQLALTAADGAGSEDAALLDSIDTLSEEDLDAQLSKLLAERGDAGKS